MMSIEEYMRQPNKFDILHLEFEDMTKNYFEIEETNRTIAKVGAMGVMYNLRCKK